MILGVIANLRKPELEDSIRKTVEWCGKNGSSLLVPPAVVERFPDIEGRTHIEIREEEGIADSADFMLAMGGDGTILAALRHAGEKEVPVLGINLGSLGFLADTSPGHVEQALESLKAGSYSIETRMTLEAEIKTGGEEKRMLASNDIVVDKGEYSRVIDIDAEVDGEYLKRYTGDGLIVSSPTGSTAYALAAGGPIVKPTMDALIVAAICPHMLASRPLVLPADSEIQLEIISKQGTALITGDGQERLLVESRDTLVIRRGKRLNRLVKTGIGLPFYDVLRKKLHWGFREPAERS